MNPHLSISVMVSPAVQGQVPHPLIVPEFLRSTSCGMTSARGHGAIVYCLNSGMLYEGDTRSRWRDGQVCPDVDKELWRLGPDGSGVFWRWTSVCPDVDKELWRPSQTARVCFGVLCANRTREVKRDFGDLPIRRSEGRVVNTPLVFKRVLFQKKRTGGKKRAEKRTRESGRENGRKEEERRKREREGKRRKESRGESEARLEWRKGLSPEIGEKKTLNAGGVKNGIGTDYTGLAILIH
ncbi:hypothetical protein TNCV_1281161 [Trichonephila clavipes]|nr:hypothetical protein TNCV_1281161 [Trichonephila clavipes]